MSSHDIFKQNWLFSYKPEHETFDVEPSFGSWKSAIRFKIPHFDVTCIKTSIDGRFVVCGSSNGSIAIIDILHSCIHQIFECIHNGSVNDLTVVGCSDYGYRILTAGSDERVMLINIELRTCELLIIGKIKSVTGGAPGYHSVAAPSTPNLLFFALGDGHGNISLWDMNSLEEPIHHVHCHNRPIASLDFSSNGDCIASGGADGVIRIFSLNRFSGFSVRPMCVMTMTSGGSDGPASISSVKFSSSHLGNVLASRFISFPGVSLWDVSDASRPCSVFSPFPSYDGRHCPISKWEHSINNNIDDKDDQFKSEFYQEPFWARYDSIHMENSTHLNESNEKKADEKTNNFVRLPKISSQIPTPIEWWGDNILTVTPDGRLLGWRLGSGALRWNINLLSDHCPDFYQKSLEFLDSHEEQVKKMVEDCANVMARLRYDTSIKEQQALPISGCETKCLHSALPLSSDENFDVVTIEMLAAMQKKLDETIQLSECPQMKGSLTALAIPKFGSGRDGSTGLPLSRILVTGAQGMEYPIVIWKQVNLDDCIAPEAYLPPIPSATQLEMEMDGAFRKFSLARTNQEVASHSLPRIIQKNRSSRNMSNNSIGKFLKSSRMLLARTAKSMYDESSIMRRLLLMIQGKLWLETLNEGWKRRELTSAWLASRIVWLREFGLGHLSLLKINNDTKQFELEENYWENERLKPTFPLLSSSVTSKKNIAQTVNDDKPRNGSKTRQLKLNTEESFNNDVKSLGSDSKATSCSSTESGSHQQSLNHAFCWGVLPPKPIHPSILKEKGLSIFGSSYSGVNTTEETGERQTNEEHTFSNSKKKSRPNNFSRSKSFPDPDVVLPTQNGDGQVNRRGNRRRPLHEENLKIENEQKDNFESNSQTSESREKPNSILKISKDKIESADSMEIKSKVVKVKKPEKASKPKSKGAAGNENKDIADIIEGDLKEDEKIRRTDKDEKLETLAEVPKRKRKRLDTMISDNEDLSHNSILANTEQIIGNDDDDDAVNAIGGKNKTFVTNEKHSKSSKHNKNSRDKHRKSDRRLKEDVKLDFDSQEEYVIDDEGDLLQKQRDEIAIQNGINRWMNSTTQHDNFPGSQYQMIPTSALDAAACILSSPSKYGAKSGLHHNNNNNNNNNNNHSMDLNRNCSLNSTATSTPAIIGGENPVLVSDQQVLILQQDEKPNVNKSIPHTSSFQPGASQKSPSSNNFQAVPSNDNINNETRQDLKKLHSQKPHVEYTSPPKKYGLPTNESKFSSQQQNNQKFHGNSRERAASKPTSSFGKNSSQTQSNSPYTLRNYDDISSSSATKYNLPAPHSEEKELKNGFHSDNYKSSYHNEYKFSSPSQRRSSMDKEDYSLIGDNPYRNSEINQINNRKNYSSSHRKNNSSQSSHQNHFNNHSQNSTLNMKNDHHDSRRKFSSPPSHSRNYSHSNKKYDNFEYRSNENIRHSSFVNNNSNRLHKNELHEDNYRSDDEPNIPRNKQKQSSSSPSQILKTVDENNRTRNESSEKTSRDDWRVTNSMASQSSHKVKDELDRPDSWRDK